jgi:hypothetical protein
MIPDSAECWGLAVRPEPGDVPAAVRVKQWLEIGLRWGGLRCERVSGRMAVREVLVGRPKQIVPGARSGEHETT